MTVRDDYPERAPKTRNRDRRGVEIGRAPLTLLTTLPGSCGLSSSISTATGLFATRPEALGLT